MVYRKRRIQPAVNKNETKVRRREMAGEQLRNMFPSVTRLTIQLNFFNAKGDSLTDRQMSLGPSDVLNTRVACMGMCGNGEIDMMDKLREGVQNRSSAWEGRGKCAEQVQFGAEDVCGYELRCRFEAKYSD